MGLSGSWAGAALGAAETVDANTRHSIESVGFRGYGPTGIASRRGWRAVPRPGRDWQEKTTIDCSVAEFTCSALPIIVLFGRAVVVEAWRRNLFLRRNGN